MTVKELMERAEFKVINQGDDLLKVISKPFCCDLLSIAMSKLPAGGAWVTVMGNMNTLAVATLTEAACVIVSEDIQLDGPAQAKAQSEGVTALSTSLPIFEAAALIQQLLLA